MSSFSGFSDDDIRKLQNGTVSNNYGKANLIKQKTSKGVHRSQHETQRKARIVSNNDENDSLPSKLEAMPENHQTNEEEVEIHTNNIQETSSQQLKPEITNVKDDFQLKQKYMEEQNRLRREQVAKALQDRTRKSLKEQKWLVEIQEEFQQLDVHLSNDVRILRTQIDSASFEYAEAEKRYQKIEKEFLDAKMRLQRMLEKKEMLTEHLCTIIGQNEERKADKLNELLLKLQTIDSDSKVCAQLDQHSSDT